MSTDPAYQINQKEVLPESNPGKILRLTGRRKNNTNNSEENDGVFRCTDIGNAERFAKRYRGKVVWCETWKCWMIFNGKYWERDRTAKIMQMAKATIRAIYDEARNEENDDRRTILAKHAIKSEENRRLKAFLEIARSELPAVPEDFNSKKHLLNCNNGTVNLKTGELAPHGATDMFTICLEADYNPEALGKLWEQFVSTIFSGNQIMIDYIQKALGMSLSGDIREQCWFLCYGEGNNGKSTLTEIPRRILGNLGHRAKIDTFLMRKDSGKYDTAEFYGKRLVTSSEIPLGSRLNESFIKDITSGIEPLPAEKKYQNPFEFMPEATIWLSVNHLPKVKDDSHGMWRRVHAVPFTVTIPPEKINKALPEELMGEAEGILAWLVAGCVAWYKQGKLEVPQIVVDATKKYRETQDASSRFFADEVEFSATGKTFVTELIERYKHWCEQTTEKPDEAALKEALKLKGFCTKRSTGGRHRYIGFSLKSLTPERNITFSDLENGKSDSPFRESDTKNNFSNLNSLACRAGGGDTLTDESYLKSDPSDLSDPKLETFPYRDNSKKLVKMTPPESLSSLSPIAQKDEVAPEASSGGVEKSDPPYKSDPSTSLFPLPYTGIIQIEGKNEEFVFLSKRVAKRVVEPRERE